MASEYVLITGGFGDIGKGVVDLIINKTDHPIIVTSRSIIGSNTRNSGRVQVIRMDASSHESVLSSAKEVSGYPISYFIQLHGNSKRNDCLVGQDFGSLMYHFDVNVFSTVVMLRFILGSMCERKFGRVVMMNTASSEFGGGLDSFGYGMAKHSVGYLTKHMAKYFTVDNVLTNCVSPGFIDTKFHSVAMGRTQEQNLERSKTVRLGRAGRVGDVSRVIYSLAFENEFISGQNIRIDGGDFI